MKCLPEPHAFKPDDHHLSIIFVLALSSGFLCYFGLWTSEGLRNKENYLVQILVLGPQSLATLE